MTIHEIHMIAIIGDMKLLDNGTTSVTRAMVTVSAENPPTEQEVHDGMTQWMKSRNCYEFSGGYQIVRQEKSDIGDEVPVKCTNPMDPVWSIPDPEPEPEPEPVVDP